MAEVTNRTILQGLKKKLDQAKGLWVDELYVLWAYRTAPQSSIRETPFSLTYGIEVVIPVELEVPNYWVMHFHELQNEETLKVNLDLLKVKREQSVVWMAAYMKKMANYHNQKVQKDIFL